MIIDARNKLKPEHMSQFADNVKGTIVVVQNANTSKVIAEIQKSELVSTFLGLSYFKDTDEVVFSNEDTQLVVTGFDINWWNQNARRYNKLYRAVEAPKSDSNKTYRVAAATLSEGTLSQIKVFEGTKKEVVDFFNNEIKTRYLDNFLKMKIVLDLAYDDGDETDVSQWLSLDELTEMEAIKIV